MEVFIPPFYLARKIIRLSGTRLVWAVLLSGICLITCPAYSQDVLWGLTSTAGPKGAGTAFSLKSDGNDFTVRHAFKIPHNPIYAPSRSLIEGSDGYFYGMTTRGGDEQTGSIFKMKSDSTNFTVLKQFDQDTDGAYPLGSLTEGSDGYLYGMASEGGENNTGTIFKLAKDGIQFTVLKSFKDSIDGAYPLGSLLEGSDGYLYGMTSKGGNMDVFNPEGSGTIFRINRDGTNFTILKNFDGGFPKAKGSLIEGSDGYFYGVTEGGGTYGHGTIFKLKRDGSEYIVLKNIDSFEGEAYPVGSLIQGTDGYLYGMTNGEIYSTIFKIASDGSNFTILKSFGRDDGIRLQGSLITDEDGRLYGMTSRKIFNIEMDGSNFTVLHSFDYSTPSPQGNLIKASSGYLYGMNDSFIFRITTSGTNFSVMHNFKYTPNSANPQASLVEGNDGNFYGVTDIGDIFKIAGDGSDFSVLSNLGASYWGEYPSGSLIQDSSGYLYGISLGRYTWGIIYKVAPDGSDFTTIHYFDNFAGGIVPIGNLTLGYDGYLYGMTRWGGLRYYEDDEDEWGCGTIFKIKPDGSEFTTIHRFDPNPFLDCTPGGLMVDYDGYLYGTRSGRTFRIKTDGSGFTDNYNGGGNGLIKGSDGYLYSMTEGGGEYGAGTIFKVKKDGTNFTVLHHFNGADGAHPSGNLVEGSEGFLYGMTQYGGDSFNSGTIFKIGGDGTGFTVLRHLNPFIDGAWPTGGLIIQKGKKTPLLALQINFQNKYTQPPAGWIKDYGLPFAEKQVADSTLTYGWKRRDTSEPINLSVGGSFSGNHGNGRWRPAPSDPLLATLMHMQGNDVKDFRGTPVESYWELAVENGEYLVTVSVGDGYRYTYSDSESHSIHVEGVPAITHFVPQGSSGSLTRFKQATVQATVSDGLLTLDADGGTNTKINYVIIQPLSSSAVIARKDFSSEIQTTSSTIQAYPNPFSNQLTIKTPLRGNVSISLYDLMGNNYYQASHQLETNCIELNLSTAKMKAGLYLIKLIAADGTTQLTKVVKR
jgi:uncharacterized repeat protein (TIGR03803 family)